MTKSQLKLKKRKQHGPTMLDGQDNLSVYLYTLFCSEEGCKMKFVVHTLQYESNI